MTAPPIALPNNTQEWRRYFSFDTDHKIIGIQYLATSFFFLLVGGLLAMLIRAELLTPQLNVMSREMYDGLFTMHGSIMIFLWTIPTFVGLGNYFVPLMIGAKDIAFPKLNAIAFWIIPFAGVLLLCSFFLPQGSAQAGWWSYPPLSTQIGESVRLFSGQSIWIISMVMLGVSSIMAGVNFVTTIFWLRAPGMTMFRMPIFVWTMLAAQMMQLIFLPSLTAALILLFFDLNLGTRFFQPFQDGGTPVLYEHMFWFYSHPAVYVWALPAWGIFSEVIPAFTRNPLFGYRSVALATILFVPITGIVWVHHMFAGAVPGWIRGIFIFTTELVGIPTGIKVFAWTATIWRSKLHLNTPMLFAIGGVIMFVIGGVTGVMLGALPFNLHVNNTYFIIGHFHYIVFNTIVFAYFAAIYYWFPKVTGRMYSESWGKLHFGLAFVGANLNFFPMLPLGPQGMLRRVSSYDPQYTDWNIVASLGAFLVGVSTLPFIANIIVSAIQGPRVGGDPWHATGLEWTTTSPPPKENFEEIPTVTEPPYSYGDPRYCVYDPNSPA